MVKNYWVLSLMATTFFLTGAGCGAVKDETANLTKFPTAGGPPYNTQPVGKPETPALIILPSQTPVQPSLNETVISAAGKAGAVKTAQPVAPQTTKRYTTPVPKSDFVRSKKYVSTLDATNYRVQFVDCHGFPGTLTMQNGV